MRRNRAIVFSEFYGARTEQGNFSVAVGFSTPDFTLVSASCRPCEARNRKFDELWNLNIHEQDENLACIGELLVQSSVPKYYLGRCIPSATDGRETRDFDRVFEFKFQLLELMITYLSHVASCNRIVTIIRLHHTYSVKLLARIK